MRFILPTSFIVVAGILFFLVTNPLYGDIKQLKTDVTGYNSALNSSTELQKTRDSLVDVYKNIKQEDKDRLDHFLPNSINNIGLILEIERLANLHGMPINNIKFDSTSSNQTNGSGSGEVVAGDDPNSYLPYGIFPMEFEVKGKYDAFLPFLNDIEHNLRLIDIKSVSFEVPDPVIGSDNTVDPNIYTYKLKIETYWLK